MWGLLGLYGLLGFIGFIGFINSLRKRLEDATLQYLAVYLLPLSYETAKLQQFYGFSLVLL